MDQNYRAEQEGSKKKRNKLPILAGIAGGVAVAAVVVMLFATGVLGASPAKRYAGLQEKLLTELVARSAEAYEKIYEKNSAERKESRAQGYSMKVVLSEECQSLMGIDAVDQVELTGAFLYDHEGRNIRILTDYMLNETMLFQSDIIANLTYQIGYLNIPQLSEEYLSLDTADLLEQMKEDGSYTQEEWDVMWSRLQNKAGEMPPELYRSLMNGLKDIWVRYEPDSVTLTKKQEYEVNGVKATVDWYEASWSELKLAECGIEIINWMRGQKELEQYLADCLGTETMKGYQTSLTDALADLEREKERLQAESEPVYGLTLGLGMQKELSGIKVQIKDTDTEIMLEGVWTEEEKDRKESSFRVQADGEQTEILYHHKSEPGDAGRKGTISVDFLAEEGTGAFEISYEDYEKQEDGSIRYHATLESDQLMGMSIGIQTDVAQEQQKLKLELLLGNLSLGSLELAGSKEEYKDIMIPDQSYEITDEEQVADYLEGADVDGFLYSLLENEHVAALLEQFDLDADTLLDIYGSGMED